MEINYIFLFFYILIRLQTSLMESLGKAHEGLVPLIGKDTCLNDSHGVTLTAYR